LFPLVLWLAIHPTLAFLSHYSLETNAYDLSVFDYALWSTLQGKLGFVPFFGHSLAAHHFMPTLLLMLPIYVLFPSPVTLIAIQLLAIVGAAILLYRISKCELPRPIVTALILAFFFSARSYSAMVGFFYIESLEPLLVFALVLAWNKRRWWRYAVFLVLLLGCKEDMPLYTSIFGVVSLLDPKMRKAGLWTIVVSSVWFVLAVGVFIPEARTNDGLPRTNPFIEARYADADGDVSLTVLAERVLTTRSIAKLFNLTVVVVFLCWVSPRWLVVASPGILLDLTAKPGSSLGLSGHYLWPMLPWVFLAAAAGARRIHARWPSTINMVAAALIVVTIAGSPLWLTLWRQPWRRLSDAQEVRLQIRDLPAKASYLAQPNLIPHLPHSLKVVALGREIDSPKAQYLVTSKIGDLWPLSEDGVEGIVAKYNRDRCYRALSTGPAFVFELR
jgi:uncharacterized membrane protein